MSFGRQYTDMDGLTIQEAAKADKILFSRQAMYLSGNIVLPPIPSMNYRKNEVKIGEKLGI